MFSLGRMSESVKPKETDLIVFGFGPITQKVIDYLIQTNNSIICVTNKRLREKDLTRNENILFLTRDEIVTNKVIANAALFSWRDKLPLEENASDIQKWLRSSEFVCHRSLLMSSASVYADSKIAQSESVKNLNSRVEVNAKFILETKLSELMASKSIPHLNLRISNAYGANLRYGLIGELFHSIHNQTPPHIFSVRKILRDYISTSDLISGINSLLKLDFEKSNVNMSTGIGTSIEEVLEIFAQKGYHFEERINILPPSEIVGSSILDCTLLSSIIDWVPKNLHTGLAEIFKSNNL